MFRPYRLFNIGSPVHYTQHKLRQFIEQERVEQCFKVGQQLFQMVPRWRCTMCQQKSPKLEHRTTNDELISPKCDPGLKTSTIARNTHRHTHKSTHSTICNLISLHNNKKLNNILYCVLNVFTGICQE